MSHVGVRPGACSLTLERGEIVTGLTSSGEIQPFANLFFLLPMKITKEAFRESK